MCSCVLTVMRIMNRVDVRQRPAFLEWIELLMLFTAPNTGTDS